MRSFRPISWHSLDLAYHRAHIRVVVIDGCIGHAGGWGIDDKWLGDGRHHDQWRDTDARFVGAAALQHQAAFAEGWAEATGELLTGELLFPTPERPPAPGGVRAALLHHVPAVGSTIGERLLMLTVAATRRTLWISNAYFVLDGAMRRALVAAARRGVDVRVLTVSKETDTQTTRYASHAFYEELLAGGVQLYEYQPAVMHAKTLVADGRWSVVGSMNLDNRSIAFNDEAVLVALDEPLAARLEAIFRADLEHAEAIHLETFRRRPLKEKLLERPARAMSRCCENADG